MRKEENEGWISDRILPMASFRLKLTGGMGRKDAGKVYGSRQKALFPDPEISRRGEGANWNGEIKAASSARLRSWAGVHRWGAIIPA